VLKIDGEGRAILTEPLKQPAASRTRSPSPALGHKFQIWEPGRFRAELAEATEKVRALKKQLGLPGERRKVRTEHGNDGEQRQPSAVAGGLARHIPVLVRPAVEFLACPRRRRLSSTPTFGAGGYSRAILAAAIANVIGIDRDPSAIARGRRSSCRRRAAGSFWSRIKFSNLHAVAARCGYERVDGVVFDLGVSSMQLDEAGAGFRSATTARSTCAWAATDRARPTCGAASERDLAAIIATLGEERHARAVRARIVPRAATRRSTPRARWPRSSRASCMRARARSIRRRARSRRCASSSTTSSPSSPRLARPSRCSRRRPAGGRAFHSLEDRIVKIVPAERSRRGGARAICRRRQAAATFSVLTKRPIVPDEAEMAPIRARARPSCGRPSAPTRRRADAPRSAAAAAVARRVMGAAMMRLLNICVIAALVLAAADVYKIKFESTRQAQRVAKLRMEIGASTTPSRRCARNGRSSTARAHPGAGAPASALKPTERADRPLDNCRSGRRLVPAEPDPIGR
jgi:16S rRNA (cytosine1402-N4)-methyltransferase